MLHHNGEIGQRSDRGKGILASRILKKAEGAMRKVALAYPDVREDHPWGESAFKVREKTFLFMSWWEERLNFTFKLPRSFEFALEYPFASPAGYGLAKARWVYARFAPDSEPPLEVLTAWLDESFRAVAPKRLSATVPPRA